MTAVRDRVFKCGTARYKRVRSRKVLQPAESINFSVVFLGPGANVELVPKLHVELHLSCSLQVLKSIVPTRFCFVFGFLLIK